MATPKYVRIVDAARQLGISRQAAHVLLKKGRLKEAPRTNRIVWVTQHSVERLEAQRAVMAKEVDHG